MNTRPYILIPIIAIGVLCIPLVLSSVNVISLYLDDKLVGSTYKYPTTNSYMTSYYCTETHVSENTFLFDEMWFTHQNYLQAIWRKINTTHYSLNLSMESRNRQPDGWWLWGADNTFEIQGNVTFKDITYPISDNFYSLDGIFITYFTLEQGEKCPILLDLQCDNTHNSDTGDVTVSEQVTTKLTISDPTHNDFTQGLYLAILAVSIITIIALVIATGIFVYREKKKDIKQYRSHVSPQMGSYLTPESSQTINQIPPSSEIQTCSQCGSKISPGASFCTNCGYKC